MSADLAIAGPVEKVPLDVQLRRYERSFRRRLRRMAGTSRQLADLVYTFPAAALIFATGQGDAVMRRGAIELVAAGADLRRVARALGLPQWVRRLPPEAFCDLILPGSHVPSSERFGLRVANRIPDDPAATRMWLAWVLTAHALHGEDFALWIAAHNIYSADGAEDAPLLPLAAYAWFSRHDGPARGLIRRPWRADQSLATAVDEARNLVLRIVLERCQDGTGAQGRWFITQRVSGYRFVPLRTPSELAHEGERMNNCVGGYARMVANGECLIYGIRRGNAHVATLEVRSFLGRSGRPLVAQLEGPGNSPVNDSVARAVDTWIVRQGRFPALAPAQLAHVPIDEARWTALWSPYWEAHERTKHLLRSPVGAQVLQLNRNLSALAAIAKL